MAGAARARREAPPLPRGQSRGLVLSGVARDARLSRSFLWLIALSTAIATLGLLQNSTAVVIGAMLLSPLLSPIMALGFGLATFDNLMLRRGATTLLAGVVVAVAVAAAIVAISPIRSVTPELLARTRPTLLDLGVALVGGLAGVHSLIYRKPALMIGVAIATALVPPLATIGFGLVTGRPDFAIGAGLLFLTNSSAIAVSASLVAGLRAFGPRLSEEQTLLQTATILGVLALLCVPLWSGLRTILHEAEVRSTAEAVLSEMVGGEDRVDSVSIGFGGGIPTVSAVVLSPRFRPDFERDFALNLSRRLGNDRFRAEVIQLRQQSEASISAQRRITGDIIAWEAERRRAEALGQALTRLAGSDPATLLVDTRLRRATINGAANSVGERRAAAAKLAESYSDWSLIIDGMAVGEVGSDSGGEPADALGNAAMP